MKLIPFAFEDKAVRVADKDGEPWFVAKDAVSALGKTWDGHSLDAIPEAWKGMVKLTTPGGEQELITINEAAVYKLAFRSNKPEADRFTNWVAGDVLPTIRKTGSYSVDGDLSRGALNAVGGIVKKGNGVQTRELQAFIVEAVAQLLPAAVEAAILRDTRRAALTYASALDLVREAGAIQKGRICVVRKISRALCALDKEEAKRVRCATTGTWLFDRQFAKTFMAQVGNDWVADHNARQTGQGVFQFRKAS